MFVMSGLPIKLTIDEVPESPFKKGKGPTTVYERALRSLVKQVGGLLKGYLSNDPLNPDVTQSLVQALNTYAEIIGPWALQLTGRVFTQVDNQDKFAWRQHTRNMSAALRKEIEETPTGEVIKSLMQSNVTLIKSIPTQAAQRVHDLVQQNMMQSARASDIAKKIMETENVTKSRAMLIARTEISKANVAMTQARAEHIGSEGYIWRTVGDMLVRKSHKRMNGRFVRWDDPPLINEGSDKKPNMIAHHAGAIWNCRCWPDPVIPER